MFESRMTWEKLKLELDLLASENPTSLLPLVFGTNSYLMPNEPFAKLYQQLSFMNYEISQLCEQKSEEERFQRLNQFFFSKMGFLPTFTDRNSKNPSRLLIPQFFNQKEGHPLLISIAYAHFAAQLDLPIYLTSTKWPHILKWIRGQERTTFVDMTSGGQQLSKDKLLELYNHSEGAGSEDPIRFDILSSKSILCFYLDELLDNYDSSLCDFSEIDILNILISLRPSHIKYLAQRALAYKDRGEFKPALQDLKRYFSFIDRNTATPQLKMAFYELQALCTLPHHNANTFH